MRGRRRSLVTGLLLLAVMALIFAFSEQPAEASSRTSGWVTALLLRLLAPSFAAWNPLRQQSFLERLGPLVRKLAHFTEFMLLGMAAALHLAPRRMFGLRAWGLAALYAVTDEVHQHFVEGRAPAGTDVLIDSAGALAGVLVMGALLALTKRRAAGYNEAAD